MAANPDGGDLAPTIVGPSGAASREFAGLSLCGIVTKANRTEAEKHIYAQIDGLCLLCSYNYVE